MMDIPEMSVLIASLSVSGTASVNYLCFMVRSQLKPSPVLLVLGLATTTRLTQPPTARCHPPPPPPPVGMLIQA